MTRMFRTLLALSVTGLVTACASPDPMASGPMMHGRTDAAAGLAEGGCKPGEMAGQHRMMADHQAMMMNMMNDRRPAAPAAR